MLDIKCRLVCPIFKQIKNIHYLLGFDGPMDRPWKIHEDFRLEILAINNRSGTGKMPSLHLHLLGYSHEVVKPIESWGR